MKERTQFFVELIGVAGNWLWLPEGFPDGELGSTQTKNGTWVLRNKPNFPRSRFGRRVGRRSLGRQVPDLETLYSWAVCRVVAQSSYSSYSINRRFLGTVLRVTRFLSVSMR